MLVSAKKRQLQAFKPKSTSYDNYAWNEEIKEKGKYVDQFFYLTSDIDWGDEEKSITKLIKDNEDLLATVNATVIVSLSSDLENFLTKFKNM